MISQTVIIGSVILASAHFFKYHKNYYTWFSLFVKPLADGKFKQIEKRLKYFSY